ncbi:MAG: hypothetical protein LAT64_13995 [Phycisphaerales bacterium]|nr:hypothetical protein [Planctomycetota bacterium]MCH8509862.1 hypothetical protein [Phycisphaerales bacterium]
MTDLERFLDAYEHDRYPEAAEIGAGLVADDACDPGVVGSYGIVLYYCGRHEEAVRWITRSLDRQDSVPKRVFLANAYHALGEKTAALREADRVIAAEPDNEDALSLLAMVLYELELYALSAAIFERYFEAAGLSEPTLAVYAGIVLTKRVHPSDACQARFRSLLHTIEDTATDCWLLAYIAVIYGEEGARDRYRHFAALAREAAERQGVFDEIDAIL